MCESGVNIGDDRNWREEECSYGNTLRDDITIEEETSGDAKEGMIDLSSCRYP